MKFTPTPIEGAFLVDLELRGDTRGFFARLFCIEEFAQHGLETSFIQANNSLSIPSKTLRGLHYQLPPMQEVKLVRCISGSFFDVILDLRPGSKTFGHSFGAVLSAENRRMMYVPRGFAHGFLTLEPHSEVFYMVSQVYSKEKERGVRWNDPAFKIDWPTTPEVISERDQAHPDFNPDYHLNMTMDLK